MSIILEFRGKDIGQWQLSTNCLRQAERLGLTNPETRTTVNHGLYQVEPKEAARSDLSKVLRAIETFLKDDTSETIQSIWG
ncbi:hypothetical protein [Aquisphaera insulae]|uniref:hypothetical protein n=1 Tax=Aquisphaera insulae TaxID=2712864 RepID=UPI0013EC0058|nr:hypothetical protein [Aquisphaera insulae]